MNDDAKRGQQQDRPQSNPGAEPGRPAPNPGQERGGPDRSPQRQGNQMRPTPKAEKPHQGLQTPQQEEGDSETGSESGDRDKQGPAGRKSER